MEPDGIVKAWTTSERMTSASSTAMAIASAYSRTIDLRRRLGSTASVGDYLQLLKPRVMSLVVFTAFVGLTLAPGTVLMFDEFYSPAGEWEWHEHEAKAFYEICRERSLRPWPLCRRDVDSGPLSEQAAFLLQQG